MEACNTPVPISSYTSRPSRCVRFRDREKNRAPSLCSIGARFRSLSGRAALQRRDLLFAEALEAGNSGTGTAHLGQSGTETGCFAHGFVCNALQGPRFLVFSLYI